MTEQRLAEIEARAKAAAPGEWVDHEFGFVFLRGDPQVHAIVTIDHEDVRGTSTADLSFIAHARTDVPALVAEVRRLRAHVAALAAEVARLRDEVRAWRDRADLTVDELRDDARAFSERLREIDAEGTDDDRP